MIVRDAGGSAVTRINELEWVGGVIYANIWYRDDIIAISESSGAVLHRLPPYVLWMHETV